MSPLRLLTAVLRRRRPGRCGAPAPMPYLDRMTLRHVQAAAALCERDLSHDGAHHAGDQTWT